MSSEGFLRDEASPPRSAKAATPLSRNASQRSGLRCRGQERARWPLRRAPLRREACRGRWRRGLPLSCRARAALPGEDILSAVGDPFILV